MTIALAHPLANPIRILVVEDEAAIAWEMLTLLKHWGYEVSEWVTSGQAALDQVQYFPPDLVLAGVHLVGKMDGMELIGRIRARWRIPVVLVSGFEKSALPPALLDTPGVAYVAKPYLPFQLKEAITKCLL